MSNANDYSSVISETCFFFPPQRVSPFKIIRFIYSVICGYIITSGKQFVLRNLINICGIFCYSLSMSLSFGNCLIKASFAGCCGSSHFIHYVLASGLSRGEHLTPLCQRESFLGIRFLKWKFSFSGTEVVKVKLGAVVAKFFFPYGRRQ